MDWDDYRYFLMVGRTPSIRAAAAQLGVSHSTVLRRLDRLEELLGARLFDRNAIGFRLTPAGEDVLQGVEDIEESVQSIDRLVTGRDSSLEGMVKVSMPDTFMHPSLMPDLTSFHAQFPNIKLEFDLSYMLADLGKREADIAIRVTESPPADLVGRKMFPVSVASYASKAYLDQHDPFAPNSTAKVLAHQTPAMFEEYAGLDHLEVAGYFDNILLRIHLVKSGLGIARLPCRLADAEPDLVRIDEPTRAGDIWILYHTDLRYTSRVRVVRDFLVQTMEEAHNRLGAIPTPDQ